jgi:hypothetical protein
MNWKKEKPKEPGYYWMRNYCYTHLKQVFEEPQIVIVHDDGEINFPGDPEPLDILRGEFYGPLEPPK